MSVATTATTCSDVVCFTEGCNKQSYQFSKPIGFFLLDLFNLTELKLLSLFIPPWAADHKHTFIDSMADSHVTELSITRDLIVLGETTRQFCSNPVFLLVFSAWCPAALEPHRDDGRLPHRSN